MADQILDIQLTFVDNKLVIQDYTDTSINHSFSSDNYVSVDFFTTNGVDVTKIIYSEPKKPISTNISDGKHIHRKMWIPKYNALAVKNSGEIFYLEDKIYQFTDAQSYKEINIIEAADAVDFGNATQTWYSTSNTVFCTSRLRECVALLQKQVIESCGKCENTNSIRLKRDFLFNALYVIDYLKETDNFDEAQRILDNLSYCGYICNDSVIFNTENCCG